MKQLVLPKPPSAAIPALALAMAVSACTSAAPSGSPCGPPDQDGITKQSFTELVSVSDTAFSVGAVDSGSTEPNITVQNLSTVKLTVTNVGTKPHGFTIECIPSRLGAGCPTQSCFPGSAQIGTLQPGASVTTSFTTPAVEGAYPLVSKEPGDTQAGPDGGLTGLVGAFVLL